LIFYLLSKCRSGKGNGNFNATMSKFRCSLLQFLSIHTILGLIIVD
jgi:hypothetical protein